MDLSSKPEEQEVTKVEIKEPEVEEVPNAEVETVEDVAVIQEITDEDTEETEELVVEDKMPERSLPEGIEKLVLLWKKQEETSTTTYA